MWIPNLLQLSSCISEGPWGNSSPQVFLMKRLKWRVCLLKCEQRLQKTGDSEVPSLVTVWSPNCPWSERVWGGKNAVGCEVLGRSCNYEGTSDCWTRALTQVGVGKGWPQFFPLAPHCLASATSWGTSWEGRHGYQMQRWASRHRAGQTMGRGGALQVETHLHNSQLFCSEHVLLFVNFGRCYFCELWGILQV